jgi:RHS repeat-associated protein
MIHAFILVLIGLWAGMIGSPALAHVGRHPAHEDPFVLPVPVATTTRYGFDAVGNLQTVTYPVGPAATYAYDTRNRLLSVAWQGGGGSLARYGYTLGPAGNRLGLAETNNATARAYTWGYDSRYRLTNETISAIPAGTLAYTYDLVGNRLTRAVTGGVLTNQTLGFDSNDRLSAAGTLSDAAGNTRTNGGVVYLYDWANRITNASNPSVNVWYDGGGNRIKKTTASATNLYLVATVNPTGYPQAVEELTVSGGTTNVARRYTYGLDLISQIQGTNATISYYGYDGLGSVRFLVNNLGSISDTCTYDAYGTEVNSSGNTTNWYRYTGEQWDLDLGMYYLRARYLSPGYGRFWTMDSFEGNNQDPLSLHKYLYAADDPVNRIDPSGHESLPSLMTGFTIKAIGFRMLMGSAVGVWDANFRGYSQWEGLAYGAVGGAIGPLIPWQLGVTLTAYGIGEALEDGDYDSALFRGATAVIGAGSFRWAKSLPGGRLGNMNTQLQNTKIAAYLQMRGWKIRAGGGRGAEERIPPPGGGRNGETWVDITVEKNVGGTVRTLRIQTVDTLANGAPTPRELNAASRIRAAFPADKLILVPKADAGAKLPTLPLFRGPGDEEEQ